MLDKLNAAIVRVDAAANPYASDLRDAAQRLRSVANKCDGAAKAGSMFLTDPGYRAASVSEFESLIANAVSILRRMY